MMVVGSILLIWGCIERAKYLRQGNAIPTVTWAKIIGGGSSLGIGLVWILATFVMVGSRPTRSEIPTAPTRTLKTEVAYQPTTTITNARSPNAESPKNTDISPRIELEDCLFIANGGKAIRQTNMAIFAQGTWGNDSQILGYGKPGEGVDVTFDSPVNGDHEIVAGLTKASDYAQITLSINGDPPTSFDGWNPVVICSGPISLGIHKLRAGENDLSVRVVGRNASAQRGGGRYGLDCLSIQG